MTLAAKSYEQNGFAVMEADELYFINGGSGSTGNSSSNGGNNGHSGKTVTIGNTTITVTGENAHVGPVSGGYDSTNHTGTIGIDSSSSGVGGGVTVQFGRPTYGVGDYSDCGVHNAVCHGASGPASGSK